MFIVQTFPPVIGGYLTGVPTGHQKVFIETQFGRYVALGRTVGDVWRVEVLRKEA